MLKEFLIVLLFGIGILLFYVVLKRFVLEKINANKWFVLAAAFALFLIPILVEIVGKKDMKGNILWFILSGAAIVMFLWYIDLLSVGNNPNVKKRKIVMKSKPKPNRIKSLNEERKDNKIDKHR